MSMRRLLAAALACALLALTGAATARAGALRISELRLSAGQTQQLRAHWVDRLLATHRSHTWAPMKATLTDADLWLMGLPPKRFLLGKRFSVPTAVYPNGRFVRLGAKGGKGKPGGGGGSGGGSSAAGPAIASFAGTGFFGIRPGAWLLTVTDKAIGWCSMAHVYGAPGAYQVSTAGHCGKTGEIGTVIGVVGGHQFGGQTVPVLIDFGQYVSSTGDGGIGKDWALISVYSQYQSLVTPTMAFWGGPIGMYTSTGEVVSPRGAIDPNPTLVQQIVHYGHGVGIGAGGTPRSGTAITWRPSYFTFFGAITPGDSGSGSNTLTGDAIGDNREAAGINTHIYVDPSLRTGVGLMAGTRATLVRATLANGQLVPYPIPTPIPLP
jgi:hypothetical protein